MRLTMRKAAGFILVGILSVTAVFMGLWFMGVISFADENISANDAVVQEEVPEPENWEIVYKSMRFLVDADAKAYIHESGCLNIRWQEDYLIQIDIEDESFDSFWDVRETKMKNITDSGYRIEREPERFRKGNREYIRYVISIEEEGAEYNKTYLEVFFTPADSDRRFLVCIRYDGIDVEKLDKEKQTALYDEALEEAEQIFGIAVPTDEEDDEIGTLWMPDISTVSEKVYLSQDSLEYADGKLEVGYHLPDGCYVLPSSLLGKSYRTEEENIYISVTVWENTQETAEERALKHTYAGFSRIHTQGQVEVEGRTFYYYTYSVLTKSKQYKDIKYYFVAYCDLENGDIYSIDGWARDNETAMDPDFYLDVMNISE